MIGLSELTEAEVGVLAMICKGMSNKEICEHNGTVRSTVENQITSIYRKTHVHSRDELRTKCLEHLNVRVALKLSEP